MSAGEPTLAHGMIERTPTTLALSPYAALRLYGRGLDLVEWLCRALLVAALVGELGIILWDITARSTIDLSLLWADEAAKLCLTMLALIGGALAYRSKHHTTVEFVRQLLPAGWREPVAIAIDGLVLVTAATVGYVSLDLLSIAALSSTPILQISAAWFVVPLSVGMGLVVLFAIERFATDYRPALAWRTLAGVAVTVSIVLAVTALPDIPRPGPQAALGLMLVLFFAAVLLGLPVSFAMLLGSLFFLQLTGTAPLIAAAQNTVDGTGNFILLTLPFFIWTGLIMERGGISLRLVRFAMALVGHLRGGLLQVVVLTIYLVSGISGSKVADVVAVGSVLRGELKKQGYGPSGARQFLQPLRRCRRRSRRVWRCWSSAPSHRSPSGRCSSPASCPRP
ncbi:TRAP transporter large permease subunit [Methylobacterium sp. J-070]|nr:TRAP transporter large permease subunit [Methylobacterium sp. J-070]MCJ2052534.1 TRAP transporter large permease subunit [Methylobacterium sp. J-070]